MVFLSRDDRQRAALRVIGVDFRCSIDRQRNILTWASKAAALSYFRHRTLLV